MTVGDPRPVQGVGEGADTADHARRRPVPVNTSIRRGASAFGLDICISSEINICRSSLEFRLSPVRRPRERWGRNIAYP